MYRQEKPPHTIAFAFMLLELFCFFGSFSSSVTFSNKTKQPPPKNMMVSANIVLGLLGLLPTLTQGANLLVSHFSGSIYSLSLDPSSNSLAITSQLSGVGGMPSWITLDSDMLYVNDESKVNDPKLSALRVSPDNTVQVEGTAAGSLGQVHNTLYGGVDGKGFIAVAQ